MEPSPEVLLSLLAVRLLGSQGVSANTEVLKGLGKAVAQAVEAGLLRESTVTPPTRGGRPGKKSIKQLDLTETGAQLLRESGRPEVASSAALAALRQGLAEDRRALREQILAALPAKGKREPKLGQEVGRLSKVVSDLAARLAKLEEAVAAREGEAVLARIDQAFAALAARLEQAGPPAAAVAPATAAGAPVLRDVLRAAYDKFRHFLEYQDGLVDIPRLYHEARRALPGLTAQALHRELLDLWDRREVELHVLNEVQRAAEPDLGIRRDEKLFYFVYWKRP
jgi:hypothetical protein